MEINIPQSGHDEEVSNIDILKDLTQDMANAIATGPQTDFFSKLDDFNSLLEYYKVEPIDVTNTWRWKSGVYDKINDLIFKRLRLDKKSKGIFHKMERAKDNMIYMRHMISIGHQLERIKGELSRGGYKRDVDIEEFKEIAGNFATKLNEQCDKAYDYSDGKVEIKPYITNEHNPRYRKLILEIIMRDLNILVYNGRENAELIQKIEAEKDSYIRIVASKNLRECLNQSNRKAFNLMGKYISEFHHRTRHPYINSYSAGYGTVCLSSYEDDIIKSFRNIDFMSLQYHLLSWAQYYHNQFSNPYNNISLFHIGLPASYSKEYKATISVNPDSCGNGLIRKFKPRYNLQGSIQLTNKCTEVNCSLKVECSTYSNEMYFQNKLHDSEYVSQVESFIGSLREYFESISLTNKYDLHDKLRDIFDGGFSVRLENYGGVTDEEIIESIWTKAYLQCFMKWNADDFMYYGLSLIKYEDELISNEECDIKEKMMKWATSSGRRV